MNENGNKYDRLARTDAQPFSLVDLRPMAVRMSRLQF